MLDIPRGESQQLVTNQGPLEDLHKPPELLRTVPTSTFRYWLSEMPTHQDVTIWKEKTVPFPEVDQYRVALQRDFGHCGILSLDPRNPAFFALASLALQGFRHQAMKYVGMPPCFTCQKGQLYRWY